MNSLTKYDYFLPSITEKKKWPLQQKDTNIFNPLEFHVALLQDKQSFVALIALVVIILIPLLANE